MEHIYIDGIGIGNYRSFGAIQLIGPLRKINVLVGQNNSGKSNVLRFLHDQLHAYGKSAGAQGPPPSLDGLDVRLGNESGVVEVSFGLQVDWDRREEFAKTLPQEVVESPHLKEMITRILRSNTLSRGAEIAWFTYRAPRESKLQLESTLFKQIEQEEALPPRNWQRLWTVLTKTRGGELRSSWIPKTLAKLSPAGLKFPRVEMIPAIRRVGPSGEKPPDNDYSGTGIIERLAEVQHPSLPEYYRKEQFETINVFLRNVTGNSDASLEIPNRREMIIVHMDGKRLPLESLGTGIHEVIILAAAATILQDRIVCIEEPELHLHPVLQKKLVRYLQNETSNQYFITTHSAHLLDTPGAAVFHVYLEDGCSKIVPAITALEQSCVCADLGYRASDILQANCLIWVEGPSDRIYINHWLKACAPHFVEGVHYSIMFYGGRLLSHLSPKDPDVEGFISLRRLNRYSAVVMDSDRDSAEASVNATKLRIQEELEEGPGFAWITDGREIENYVDPEVLLAAIKALDPDAEKLVSTGQYDHCMHYETKNGELKEKVDKVKVARKVAEQVAKLDVYDLCERLEELVKFIDEANGVAGESNCR